MKELQELMLRVAKVFLIVVLLFTFVGMLTGCSERLPVVEDLTPTRFVYEHASMMIPADTVITHDDGWVLLERPFEGSASLLIKTGDRTPLKRLNINKYSNYVVVEVNGYEAYQEVNDTITYLRIPDFNSRTDYTINWVDEETTILIDMVLDTFRIRAY